MDLIAAWLAFPLVLLGLAAGCGLALQRSLGLPLPPALLPGVGLALIVVVGELLTQWDRSAELAAPACLALAAAGWLGAHGALRRPRSPWPLLAAGVCFAAYAAPIVLSGDATFAGYGRLDDSATWMALTDRVMEHGRSLDGLAPSTYETTLALNIGRGYPLGAFLPLGVARELTGQDVAWVIQPYMAVLGAVLALALWSLARPLVASPARRAVAAGLAAQPALLYGYYLWGGVKELAAAALIATAAALLGVAAGHGRSPRALAAIAVVAAALVAVASAGALIWLAPLLCAGSFAAGAGLGASAALERVGLVAALTALLCLPALLGDGLLPAMAAPLTSPTALGNLYEPLNPAQALGIWPAGDLRLAPQADALTHVLVALAAVAVGIGIAGCVRRRAWPLLAYVAGSLASGLAILAAGSPWIDAKALAIASPALLLGAAVGVASLLGGRLRPVGVALAVALAAGVLWSNLLAGRDAPLAPRAELGELERIGEAIAGEGPTLIGGYQPYARRHFLREADPQPPADLAAPSYRTLVLPHGRKGDRPASPYRLVWRGAYYEAWQRPPRAAPSVRPPAGPLTRRVASPAPASARRPG